MRAKNMYKTRDGRKALYHGSEEHKSSDGKVWIYHYLALEPISVHVLGRDSVINQYEAYVNVNGIGRFAYLKYNERSGASAIDDIVSEWQDSIDEEKLDELAKEYIKDKKEPSMRIASYNGFKAGYRKAKHG